MFNFSALRLQATRRVAAAGRRTAKAARLAPPQPTPATPRAAEAALDVRQGAVTAAVRPAGFKSYYAHEAAGWSATFKVDYDLAINRPSRTACRAAAAWLRKRGIRLTAVRAYTTRKGLHLRAWAVDTVGQVPSDVEIWTVQNVLNDDPWRVTFNLRRVEKGVVGWNVLFTEKWKDGILVSWETYDPGWTAKFESWLGVAKKTTTKRSARSRRSKR